MTFSQRIDSHALLNIILVEDDDGDAKAIRRALSKARIANPIHRVTDGVEGLAFLRGDTGTPPPSYILLVDLNMPRMNGIEFTRALRQDKSLSKAIVFIMTTSKDERDKAAAYDQNVAGYILKSNVGEDFKSLIGTLDHYWHIVELPDMTQPVGS